MADLIELDEFTPGVFQIEEDTVWLGGEAGPANNQGKALANRTKWLKGQIEAMNLTVFILTLLDDADAATARATLGAASPADIAAAIAALVDTSPATLDTLNELAAALGDDANFAATVTTALAGKQPLDDDLTAIAALVSAADKMPYATGAGAWALATLSAFARTLLDDADAAAMRTTLGLGDVALKTMAADFASSFAANGYQKLPGGLIIQWGTANGGATTGTVTFPIAFPAACLACIATDMNNSATDVAALAVLPTTTNFAFASAQGSAAYVPGVFGWVSIGY